MPFRIGVARLEARAALGQRTFPLEMTGARAEQAHAQASLAAELCAALRRAPGLKVVKLADGVDDNWSFLAGEVPDGVEALDFFHASEHLRRSPPLTATGPPRRATVTKSYARFFATSLAESRG
jgi:hypothetical protein